MNKEELFDAIQKIVAEVADIDPSEIKPDTHFVNDIGMDSLMALEVVALIEQRYKIKLPEDELMEILTLNKAVEIAAKYIEQGEKPQS